MRTAIFALGIIGAALPFHGALACAPPPPGWVQPTEEQSLARSLSTMTDIVYGVVTRSGGRGEPNLFKVIHVYRGAARKGDIIEAPPGLGHPMPYCGGMMGPAFSKPVGAYGVIAFKRSDPYLDFIEPRNVQLMIRNGWIKSARAR